MPIEIRITDIKNLTRMEIVRLNHFLLHSCGKSPEENDVTDGQEEPFAQEMDFEPALKEMPVKTRKKRKDKDADKTTVTILDEFSDASPNDLELSKELLEHMVAPITYDELLSFILESVRTKRLGFDQILTVIKSHGVPSMNELKDYPNPSEIYRVLKELAHE